MNTGATKDQATKALVPRLRFPEFRTAEGWSPSVLAHACDMQAGKFVAAANISERNQTGLFPCYGGNGLRGYTTTYTHDGTYSLIGRQGALCGNVRLVNGKFHATEHAVVATPKTAIDAGWLYYALDLLNLNRFATGQAQPGLSVDVLENVPLAIPVLELEQQKIAACLDSLDELIAAQGRKVEALKTHKKGLMQQLFPREGETQPRLRFPEFRNAGEWNARELSDFITERNEYPKEKVPLFSLTIEDGVTPKTERYERSFLVNDEAEAYKLVMPNDFAFNPMNLRFGAIGRHSGTGKVAVSKYYNIFSCDKTVDSRFCETYFRSERMVAYYDEQAIGSLIEKRRVHFAAFLKFSIRFPRLQEQERIAEFLTSLDALITAANKELDTLKTHKQGLMQQLFPSVEAEAA